MSPANTRRDRALQWLHEQPADSHLKSEDNLKSIFPNGPHRSYDRLDIIVADAEGMLYSVFQCHLTDLLSVLELTEGLGDADYQYKRGIKKSVYWADISYIHVFLILTPLDLNERLDSLAPGLSPSEIASKPSEIVRVLDGQNISIYLGRPGGAPTAVFNPTLASLQQRLDNLEQGEVSCTEVHRAAQYIVSATKFFEERNRQNDIKELISKAIGGKPLWKQLLRWAGGIKPDGSWWYNKFPILVLEIKNMWGLHGDAILQAALVYSKILSPTEVRCRISVALSPVTYLRL